MARRVRDRKTDSRSARSRLAARREPYWTVIGTGCALGYRRGSNGGTWIARFRDDTGTRHYQALGAADDAMDPDGLTALSFAQAQEAARRYFADKAREVASGDDVSSAGPWTVSECLRDYFTARDRRGSKGLASDRKVAAARIEPALGTLAVANLSTRTLRDWHTKLAEAPKLVRSRKGATTRATKALDAADPEAVRARRSSANRVLTILKAALNHAFQEGHARSDEAWRKVKPFREVDAPVVRFLTAAECVRLVNASEGSFRDLARGALLTGCRYGELARMKVGDYNSEAGTVTVRVSKAGKPRHVVLNDEGRRLFDGLGANKSADRLLFTRADDLAWSASQQQRPLEEACARAKIIPAATFHVLRHTYASTLAMRGVPMGVIAAQLGHSDTRMTEKHYAHLAPSYVAETVRAALPDLGLVEKSNVAHLGKAIA